MNEYPEIDCDPPVPAEIGDVWFCPHCARKYYYVMMTLGDYDVEVEAWFTSEV